MLGFAYEKAECLLHALKLLESNKNSYIYAGGTDLLLKIKHKQLKPKLLIGINGLNELSFISEQNEGKIISIGSLTKISEILSEPLLREKAPILISAASKIGSVELRNMGTVGGNICNAGANCGACGLPGCKMMTGTTNVKPCAYASYSDLMLPLLVLKAKATICSSEGDKNIDMLELLSMLRRFGIAPGVILKEVRFITKEGSKYGCAYVNSNGAMGVTLTAVFVGLTLNDDGTCRDMIMAVGGSSIREITLISELDQIYKNKKIEGNVIEGLVNAAMDHVEFIDNMKYSIDYTIERTKQATKIAIKEAASA